MGTLHEVLRVLRHVVAQVVEAELIVRAEGNVGKVCFATLLTIGLMLVDAIDTQAVEHIDGAHPFRVTLCQIVIDSDDVYAVTCKCIEEDGECGGEGLTFTREHLGNLALMQNGATEELDVEVNHVPLQVVATCYPVIVVDSLVAFDVNKVMRCGKVAVEVVCCDLDVFVCCKELCGSLYDGEYFSAFPVKSLLEGFEHVLLQLVYL